MYKNLKEIKDKIDKSNLIYVNSELNKLDFDKLLNIKTIIFHKDDNIESIINSYI